MIEYPIQLSLEGRYNTSTRESGARMVEKIQTAFRKMFFLFVYFNGSFVENRTPEVRIADNNATIEISIKKP